MDELAGDAFTPITSNPASYPYLIYVEGLIGVLPEDEEADDYLEELAAKVKRALKTEPQENQLHPFAERRKNAKNAYGEALIYVARFGYSSDEETTPFRAIPNPGFTEERVEKLKKDYYIWLNADLKMLDIFAHFGQSTYQKLFTSGIASRTADADHMQKHVNTIDHILEAARIGYIRKDENPLLLDIGKTAARDLSKDLSTYISDEDKKGAKRLREGVGAMLASLSIHERKQLFAKAVQENDHSLIQALFPHMPK